MADNESGEKKAVVKKTAKKAPTAKKAAVKKAASVKKSTTKKAASKKSASVKSPSSSPSPVKTNSETLSAIKALVNEMRQEHDSRDRQITSLVQEIRQGFTDFSEHSRKTESERTEEMDNLYKTLDGAFNKVEGTTQDQQEHSLHILKALSESIMTDHEQTLKEVQEQKKLQDKKIEHLTKLQDQKSGRNRLIAIPGIIIAIIAIIYMFYVVSIMEGAMTSMSGDMSKIQMAVDNMSNKMDVMSVDTSSMNTNMTHLNSNMAQMSRDLNMMNYNVSPTMRGLHDMMPWSP